MAKYTDEERKRHVDAWMRSGLSARNYAARGGMDCKSLMQWRSRLRGAGLARATAMTWRRHRPGFVEVFFDRGVEGGGAPDGGAEIEIVTKSGEAVRVGDGFEEQTLRRVLDVLGSR